MSKNKGVFDYESYQTYLRERLPTSGEHRGQRSLLAKALRCQTAFVSRVVNGQAEFSLEHSVAVNRFLQHTEEEGEFFVLLVHLARAGTPDLKRHYERQLERIRDRRKLIGERIGVSTSLSEADQTTYYSTWHYAAIHVLLMVPSIRTRADLARHLRLPEETIARTLDFLVRTGLARREGTGYAAGTTRIHLREDSPSITRHHANWRLKAMQSQELASREDLFFSGPICISETDAAKLKGALLTFLEQNEDMIRKSPEEAAFCLNFDFFRV